MKTNNHKDDNFLRDCFVFTSKHPSLFLYPLCLFALVFTVGLYDDVLIRHFLTTSYWATAGTLFLSIYCIAFLVTLLNAALTTKIILTLRRKPCSPLNIIKMLGKNCFALLRWTTINVTKGVWYRFAEIIPKLNEKIYQKNNLFWTQASGYVVPFILFSDTSIKESLQEASLLYKRSLRKAINVNIIRGKVVVTLIASAIAAWFSASLSSSLVMADLAILLAGLTIFAALSLNLLITKIVRSVTYAYYIHHENMEAFENEVMFPLQPKLN